MPHRAAEHAALEVWVGGARLGGGADILAAHRAGTLRHPVTILMAVLRPVATQTCTTVRAWPASRSAVILAAPQTAAAGGGRAGRE